MSSSLEKAKQQEEEALLRQGLKINNTTKKKIEVELVIINLRGLTEVEKITIDPNTTSVINLIVEEVRIK